MATDTESNTTRTTVKTYVPAYQRQEWDDHADELDMSRSEFVRSMVQAGRRGFDPSLQEGPDGANGQTAGAEPDEPASEETHTASKPVVSFEETVLEALREAEYLDWEDLVGALTEDIEGRLEETIQSLQADNRIRYSGPKGGYVIEE